MHALFVQRIDHALRGRHQRVALAIKIAEVRLDQRFEEAELIVAGIGFEARVHRAEHGDVTFACPFNSRSRTEIRRRDVHHVGPEVFEIAAHLVIQPIRDSIFRAAGDGHGGQADQIALRFERWCVDGR